MADEKRTQRTCNRTRCQATETAYDNWWWNWSTRAWCCQKCALAINEVGDKCCILESNLPTPAIGAEALEKVRELASQIATMRVQTGGGEDVDSRAENSHRKFLGEKILALLAPHGKG